MDQQKLRALVFEKTGIKIDTSDPVFAVVAMNEALLEEAVQRHLGVLEQTSRTILQQLQTMRGAEARSARPGGAALVDDIWEQSASVQQTNAAASPPHATAAPLHDEAAVGVEKIVAPLGDVPVPAAAAAPVARSLGADLRLAGLTALFSALLVLCAQMLFAPSANLSAQQQAQLRQAEKMQKLLPTLDAKTRSQIEAALQTP